MREIRWHASPGPEIRLQGTSTTARYGFASSRRSGSGSLFHEPYDGGHGELKLPAALLPCISHDGEPIDICAAVKDVAPSACLIPATLVLPAGHPPVVEHSGKTEMEVVNAFWLSGLSEPQIDEVTRRCGALPGILIQQDESVASLGHAFPRPLWIQRLSRIVLSPRSEIADNTDAGLSMGRLLERFVHRFSAPQHALPHLCIATGYLYQRGLSRTLALLQNPAIKTIHLLFSGKTDWATARALTAKLSETLREEMDQEPTDALWRACQDAAQTGRLQVRVYTDAFLHAKLFLGHDGDDDLGKLRNGYAVIGSSNVSGPGLQGGGNLELDVSIDSRDRTTELYQWFQHRWNEGSLPEPVLLEVLSAVRPLPPPVFQIEGLDAVWRAGAEGRLGPPEQHLALLAQIHGRQIEGLRPPSDEAFPQDVERQIQPTPEQAEGVLALAQRLLLVRVAFLADSVGLGKTITALGLAAYLARNNMLDRAALVAPQKLWDQWEDDARRAGIPFSIIQPINRHKLERWTPEEARAQLAPFDLIIVEEAHESLRQRNNKLWQNLRAHLRQHPGCRLVLVSATPWNNRREDIYNYLLLGWQDGRPLREHYRALGETPLQHYLSLFTAPPATGARIFEELPRDRYRQIFDAVFVQRTRSTLELLGRALNFPERRIHAANTPASESHDALYAALGDLLATLNVPYQEPFRAILRASGIAEEEQEEEAGSNLKRSFLIQLYKRAESSLFALAVSLSRMNRRLLDFQRKLEELRQAPDPKAALASYLRESYLRLDDEALGVDEESLGEWLSAAEKVRYAALNDLLQRLDGPATTALLERLIREQIVPDRGGIARLRARLSFSLDEQSPKDLLLCRVARHAFSSGYKPILVASYADTATRAFIRLIDLFPDARIALALGDGEAWMYRPERTRRAPLTAAEWEAAMDFDPQDRRLLLLQQAGRAEQIPRDVVLDAFSPRAR
jgi:hypothetical protein